MSSERNEQISSFNINGFDEWQSIDDRNGSEKSSSSDSQNSSSWYLVQVRKIEILNDLIFRFIDLKLIIYWFFS